MAFEKSRGLKLRTEGYSLSAAAEGLVRDLGETPRASLSRGRAPWCEDVLGFPEYYRRARGIEGRRDNGLISDGNTPGEVSGETRGEVRDSRMRRSPSTFSGGAACGPEGRCRYFGRSDGGRLHAGTCFGGEVEVRLLGREGREAREARDSCDGRVQKGGRSQE